ncbi:hypothetical protein CsatA_009142 [Cannabis sativa]
MEYSTQLIVPKIENPFDVDWFFHENPNENLVSSVLDFPTFDQYENYSQFGSFSYQNDQLPQIDFNSFEDFDNGFSLENAFLNFEEPNMVDELKPHTNMVITSFGHHNHDKNLKSCHDDDDENNIGYDASRELYGSLVKKNHDEETMEVTMSNSRVNNYNNDHHNNRKKKKKAVQLELDEIQRCFKLPIKDAAMELGIGVTRLKKRCRELNIMRWPHRKLKSLKYLLKNVKNMGLSNNEIMMLEEQKRLVEEIPDMELTERAKKLRQACFKANYKSKRSLASSLHRS